MVAKRFVLRPRSIAVLAAILKAARSLSLGAPSSRHQLASCVALAARFASVILSVSAAIASEIVERLSSPSSSAADATVLGVWGADFVCASGGGGDCERHPASKHARTIRHTGLFYTNLECGAASHCAVDETRQGRSSRFDLFAREVTLLRWSGEIM
jgi:hypothetical protein